MRKSILWYQHEDSSIGDVIYCNGKRIVDQKEAIVNFDIIKSKADKVIKKQEPWCGKVGGHFFMKGFLQSKDDHQRKMCFMYVTDDKDYECAIQDALKAAGLTMSEDSEQCLKKSQVPSWQIVVVVGLIILTIIAAIVYLNRSSQVVPDSSHESSVVH